MHALPPRARPSYPPLCVRLCPTHRRETSTCAACSHHPTPTPSYSPHPTSSIPPLSPPLPRLPAPAPHLDARSPLDQVGRVRPLQLVLKDAGVLQHQVGDAFHCTHARPHAAHQHQHQCDTCDTGEAGEAGRQACVVVAMFTGAGVAGPCAPAGQLQTPASACCPAAVQWGLSTAAADWPDTLLVSLNSPCPGCCCCCCGLGGLPHAVCQRWHLCKIMIDTYFTLLRGKMLLAAPAGCE